MQNLQKKNIPKNSPTSSCFAISRSEDWLGGPCFATPLTTNYVFDHWQHYGLASHARNPAGLPATGRGGNRADARNSHSQRRLLCSGERSGRAFLAGLCHATGNAVLPHALLCEPSAQVLYCGPLLLPCFGCGSRRHGRPSHLRQLRAAGPAQPEP